VEIGSETNVPSGARERRFVPPSVEEIAPHFPQLEILSLLGRGGMGAVYKARQTQLDRLVALKILPPDVGREAQFADRFVHEAKALAKLNHPHIVTLYEFGQVDGRFYFLMEFVDGVNLRELLANSRISAREALAIVPQICEALQYAHDRGIVHRDIKPENILLNRQGQVKIADFGIAKIIAAPASEAGAPGVAAGNEPLTQAGGVLGTPQYMAPEQVKAPVEVDHRADIYSLGVVFYEMLTGEMPGSKLELPSRRVVVDVRLDEVVLRALEMEPDRRYQHARQIKDDVETIASGDHTMRAGYAEADAAPTRPSGRLLAARWTARLIGTALLLFCGIFLLAEGLPAIAIQPEGVQLNFAALVLMLAGFIIGWGREGTAAVLITAGWMLWNVSEGSIKRDLFQIPLPVGLLYGYCWWSTHGHNTPRVIRVAAALLVALVLGLLLMPTSVFISGTVADASTGKPVPRAEFYVDPRARTASKPGTRPNARSDKNGHYTIYVGWYSPSKQLCILAPGFSALETTLGKRPFAQRRLKLDYRLAPTAESMPLGKTPVPADEFTSSTSAPRTIRRAL
jgi:predicted Ser/Thr protein kinase